MIVYVLLAIAVAAAAFVRLAPSDPARWHTDPGTGPITDCAQIILVRGSSRVTCQRSEDPVALLAALDTIALATPRTIRLAGSAEEGRITWLTRSAVIGFPDFTTAQATSTPAGTRLDIHARQRFGDYDWGVNGARLTSWLSQLQTMAPL